MNGAAKHVIMNEIFKNPPVRKISVNKKPVKQHKFTFIDLFAGIGGFHVAMENIGGKCVFACEIEKNAKETYKLNHKIEDDIFAEDIKKVESSAVPGHDVLCAGFPCQPFSQAGFKKGFDDIRGTLFFDIARIIEAKNLGRYSLKTFSIC